MSKTILVCLQGILPNEKNLCNNSESGSFAVYLGDACFVDIDKTQALSITMGTQKMSGYSYCKESRCLNELGFPLFSLLDMKIISFYLYT